MKLEKTVWHYLHKNPAGFLAGLEACLIYENEFSIEFKALFKALCSNTSTTYSFTAFFVDYIIEHGTNSQLSTSDFTEPMIHFCNEIKALGFFKGLENKVYINIEILLIAAAIFELNSMQPKQFDAVHTFAHKCLEMKVGGAE